jgi:NAD(P)-dependent dehydrogenase (short-subunit alcohol dehydrogenase family)
MSLEEHIVLVTAGAGGAGRVIAQHFKKEGARVAICDIDEAAVKEACENGFLGYAIDASSEGAIDELFSNIEAKLGNVSIVVNNVGIAGPTAGVEDVSLGDWERTLACNVTSHFLCIRRAVPAMKLAGRGCIINISSGSAKLGLPMRVPYVVSKAAVLSLTQTLARELGPSGIRVNSILPGAIRGPRIERIIAEKAKALGVEVAAYEREMLRYISLRTMVEPDDIAEMCVFLASERGSKISGQQIGVDGNAEFEE